MKRIISILIAITLVISVFAIIPLTTASADDTQTVYIGINSTWGQDFVTSTARVHYWGGDTTGDAALTAVGTDKEIDEITYDMYQAEIPADATGFKFHNGETWYGDDGTISETCNAAFVNGAGLNDVAYGYYSVPAEDAEYYIVGNFTDWQTDDAYKMTKDDSAEGDLYVFEDLYLIPEYQFKVGAYVDGEFTVFPDDLGNNYGENGEITQEGIYTVYFRPNYDGGDDWYYNCLYVADVTPEEPTEGPTEDSTGPAEDEPVEDGCYLWGTFSDWEADEAYKMTANDAADTDEFIFEGLVLTTNDKFKVIVVNNGGWTYYPEDSISYGDYGEITRDGTYTVYFRPNGDGGEDWYYNCLYVADVTPEDPTEPAVDPTVSPTEPAVDPTGSPEEPGESTFYVVGSFNEWQTEAAYQMTKNAEAEGEYYLNGVEMFKDNEFKIVETNGSIQGFEPVWYPSGFDNNYVVTADGIYDIYFRPNYDGGEDWYFNCLYVADVTPEEPTEPAVDPTESPTEPAVDPTGSPEEPVKTTFYVIGSFNGWMTDDAYMMTENAEAEGEYVLSDVALNAYDQLKVKGSDDSWYPNGMDDAYVITADGIYDIYFRPNYDGGEDWYYNCLYVADVTPEEPTEPAVSSTVTLYFTNNKNWDSLRAYIWEENGGEVAEWPGVEPTYVGENDYNETVYSITVDTDLYDYVIFNNGSGVLTVDININEAVTGGGGIYCLDTVDGSGHYNVGFYAYAPEVPELYKIEGNTISLKDEIAVNYYVYVDSASYPGEISALYTCGLRLDAAATVTALGNDEYKISCSVNARSMTDNVTLTVYAGATEVFTDDSYSVAEYCTGAASEYQGDENLKALLCAMLDYGGAVQEYFDYYGGGNASNIIPQVDADWSAPDAPAGFAADGTTINNVVDVAGLTYEGAVLVTTGKTAVRLYFSADDPTDLPEIKVSDNNGGQDEESAEWKYSEAHGYRYIEYSLRGDKIFDDTRIKINGTTYYYNAKNYYNYAMNSTAAKFVKVRPVLKAMYNYYVAANNYQP